MLVTSIRFSDKTYQKVKKMAKFQGVSTSSFIRSVVEEKIEDQEDYDECVEYSDDLIDTIPRDKVIKDTFSTSENE